ncbi:putative polysaccharide biosynthesis protein [Lentibacillus jeotgali]|uniref:putative polysaccharide biosynthesis protein n=1 Tax=Lentibacillus jeotgali TaxID=558169 RepID=UPI0002627853|nr:polysaccharide biosynthesis protein [Lentibacillus jeotgali]
MMGENQQNKLMKGALLLTLAGFLSKLLSAGYRIPLQNLTGDMGFYIYQQVYPFLGIALIAALYGFPSAISKMIADFKAQGKGVSLRYFYLPVLLVMLLMMGSVFLFLFFNAEEMAVWAGDNRLRKTYELAAFIFLLIPFSALLRGVFQGRRFMKPTAYSQIGEQLTRVFLIIAAAIWIYSHPEYLYNIGQAAAVASIMGTLTAIMILLIFFFRCRPSEKQQLIIPWQYYVKTLLVLGIAAALNHMVLIIIQFADTFTLIPSLQEFGLSQREAMKAKGIFDRGQPLIQLGTVLGSSFALALVPAVSGESLKSGKKAIGNSVRSALLVSSYLAAGATAGLVIIFPEANVLLFQNDAGSGSLRILVIAILLSSVGITAASILQGMGFMKRTAGFVVIAFFLKWTGNQVLVPLFGITGSALATVLGLAAFAAMMIMALKRKLPELKLANHLNWTALVIALAGMAVFLAGMDYLFEPITSRAGLLFYVMFISIAGAIVYLILLLRLRAFTEKELSMFPFAAVLIRIHKERDR